jgi:hypothetical protein
MAANDKRLRALAFHLLGSRDAMDDVLQEVYLKAHGRLTTCRCAPALSTSVMHGAAGGMRSAAGSDPTRRSHGARQSLQRGG